MGRNGIEWKRQALKFNVSENPCVLVARRYYFVFSPSDLKTKEYKARKTTSAVQRQGIGLRSQMREYLISLICVSDGIESCADIATCQKNGWLIKIVKNSIDELDRQCVKRCNHLLKCSECMCVCVRKFERVLFCMACHQFSPGGAISRFCTKLPTYAQRGETTKTSFSFHCFDRVRSISTWRIELHPSARCTDSAEA